MSAVVLKCISFYDEGNAPYTAKFTEDKSYKCKEERDMYRIFDDNNEGWDMSKGA